MKKVKLTLNKANKVKVDLTKYLTGEVSKRLEDVNDEYLFSKRDSSEPDSIAGKLLEMVKASKEKLDNELKIASDFQRAFFNLKSSIFKANLESGLSDVLLKLSENETKTKYISSLSSQIDRHAYSQPTISSDRIDLTSRQISSIISRKEEINGVGHMNVSVTPLTKKEIEKMLRDFKKEKDKLNDEKTRINNVTEITVEMEDGVIDFLGL